MKELILKIDTKLIALRIILLNAKKNNYQDIYTIASGLHWLLCKASTVTEEIVHIIDIKLISKFVQKFVYI